MAALLPPRLQGAPQAAPADAAAGVLLQLIQQRREQIEGAGSGVGGSSP
jgi:hypothetical protein